MSFHSYNYRSKLFVVNMVKYIAFDISLQRIFSSVFPGKMYTKTMLTVTSTTVLSE
jgi:hypothetical protein